MLSSQPPSEIVFSAALTSTLETCTFPYDHGPIKLKIPRKRGRPLGSTTKSSKKSIRSNDHQQHHFVLMDGDLSANPNKISDETRTAIRKRVMANYMQRKHKRLLNESKHDSSDLMRGISRIDPFDAFPVRLKPYMLDLLKYYSTIVWKSFYTIESYTSVNPMKDFWIPIAFYDDALLHLLIGCADAHASQYKSYSDRSSLAIRHISDALSIIKIRIETMQSVTAETVGAIATLAFIEKFRGYHDNWRTHMKGLKKLVDLLGGLSSLETRPMIMGKIFRADLSGSIETIETPFFHQHYLPYPLHTTSKYTPASTNSGFSTLNAALSLDETIAQAIISLNEATQLTSSLLRNKNNSHVDAARIRFLVTQTQYTLLSTQRYPNTTHKLCRLVLIFYAECLANQSPPRSAICNVPAGKFRDLWNDLADDYDNNQRVLHDTVDPQQYISLEFKLWSMFVAASAISTSGKELMVWYMRSIIETASEIGITSWDNLVSVFSTFLWDKSVHGDRYLEIWSDAQDLWCRDEELSK